MKRGGGDRVEATARPARGCRGRGNHMVGAIGASAMSLAGAVGCHVGPEGKAATGLGGRRQAEAEAEACRGLWGAAVRGVTGPYVRRAAG